jgi:molecular chaperone DnaJ
MQLRVPGKGHAGVQGMPPGDLLLMITVREHDLFVRDGDDLHILSTITYPQAVLGATLEAPTLQGHVKLAIPQGTESNTVFRVRGKGMPRLRGGHGDLLVTVKISVPKQLRKEEKELIEKLAAVEKPKGFFERFRL